MRTSENVIVLRLEEPAWQGAQGVDAPLAPSAAEAMDGWGVADLVAFLKGQDLAGPAAALSASGFNGHDFARTDFAELTADLRLTPFAAKKVLSARASYLGAPLDAARR